MLTKDDLKQIKQLLDPIEQKIDDVRLETQAIHQVIKTQSSDFDDRIERLEQRAGVAQ
jgi:hypothetical protein